MTHTHDTDPHAEELDARLRRLEEAYDDLDATLAATTYSRAPTDSTEPERPAEPLYPNLQVWVGGWFAPVFGRRLGAAHWCARWWAHPEAVLRLEALWRTWETLRLDPVFGMAIWLRDHLDPQRAVLFGEEGPFQACDGHQAHQPLPDLPVEDTPPGWRVGHT